MCIEYKSKLLQNVILLLGYLYADRKVLTKHNKRRIFCLVITKRSQRVKHGTIT